MTDVRIINADCLDALAELPDASVDCVVTDPPYPCIKRSYGYWTEAEWFALMNPVVEHCRRVLTPTGSAVFILQPNSERAGRMRTWLWEFMAKWGKEWGMVQDAWWWNWAALPVGGANTGGLLKSSIKPCVWLGEADCYRDQSAVRVEPAESTKVGSVIARNEVKTWPSGHEVNRANSTNAWRVNGGVTPFNVIPCSHQNTLRADHAARTPEKLCRWWIRYICPPGGTVLDPFIGSGTVALAALAESRKCIGIERNAEYAEIARRRVDECVGELFAAAV